MAIPSELMKKPDATSDMSLNLLYASVLKTAFSDLLMISMRFCPATLLLMISSSKNEICLKNDSIRIFGLIV